MKKKLTVNTLAFGNLRQRKKQYTLMIIGIILAMIFTSGVPFFISCSKSSQEEIRFRRQGKQNFIIINAQNYDFAPMLEQGSVESIGYGHILSYGWNEENERADFSDGTMIGWLDETAESLYYPQIIEGRMPEKEGEIIIEKNALSRMRLETKVGEKITFKELTCNGGEFLAEETEKTYTLVGIMDDKKSYLESMHSESLDSVALIPAAFVVKGTQTDIGGKEALIALLTEKYMPSSLLWETIPYEDRIQSDYVRGQSVGDAYSEVANNSFTFAFLFILLSFLSCFGIVNTFNSNLKERKTQIGMLKAVGATRRQIINIFGREAFIICALSAPLSVGLSYGAVKLFAGLMGENFIFKPDVTVLLLGALFGIICVMLSALIPLLSISKLPPMQAIRDIELMRKMKNKKIKSQRQFNVSRLLAKRKLTFSRVRQTGVCLIITLSIVICCISMSFLYATVSESYKIYNSDYQISDYGRSGASNSFINFKSLQTDFTENSKYEIYDLPQVAKVYGQKTVNINLLFEEDVPEYLQVNEYASIHGTSSRYKTAYDVRMDSYYSEAVSAAGGSAERPAEISPTAENIKEYMHYAPNPDYTYTKEAAGIEGELFNTTVIARSEGILDFNEDLITDGEINYDKLNSGEEVIIFAPERIGFSIVEYDDGFSWGLYNMDESEKTGSMMDEVMKGNTLAQAENPFKAGDTLTLCLLYDDGNGNLTREDRQVKIGAVIGNKNNSAGNFGIYTTVKGLDKFSTVFNYDKFDVELKEDCTAEIDAEMQAELSAMFPGKDIGSAFAFNEGEKQELRTTVLSVGSLIIVMLTVCISLINNSVSAQIREGKRSIGTLRAVGASEKELTLSYLLQIASMLIWGFGAGTVIYAVSYYAIGFIVTGEYWPVVLWPAFLVFGIIALACYINLKAKIKTITKYSIVENIRELG